MTENIQNQHGKRQSLNDEPNGHVLLICDFTGKIVFWKGDTKVLELSNSEYLHKNILQLDFTLYSRVRLAAQLRMDIFKTNNRVLFQLEMVRSTSSGKVLYAQKVMRLSHINLIKYFWSHVKNLNVAVSTISGNFKKTTMLKPNYCQVSFHQESKPIIPKQLPTRDQTNLHYDKFLLFEIEDNSRVNKGEKGRKFTIEQIQRKIVDMEYVMRKRKEKGMFVQKKFEGEFDRLFVKNMGQEVRNVGVNDGKSCVVNLPASFMSRLDSSYHTRSRIISKVQFVEKQVKIEESQEFKIVEEK